MAAGACEQGATNSTETPAAAADEHWKLVRAYIDTDTAWHARDNEIRASEDSAEEKQRRYREERGEHPDITLAVGGAKAILATEGHPQVAAAAEFLMEHTRKTERAELGAEALAKVVGPDWRQVQDHLAAAKDWNERMAAIGKEASSKEERKRRQAELDDPPKPLRAIAAALAILDTADHGERRAAAEFLINDLPRTTPNASAYVYRGAKAWRAPPLGTTWPRVSCAPPTISRPRRKIALCSGNAPLRP